MIWNALFIVIFGPLVLLGVLLLWRGFRGRIMDDHPYCRGCGFDLTGLSADRAACPECGRDLSQPKAVQQGRRVRRRGLLIAGAMCLLLALVPVGLLAVQSLSNFQLQPHKPMWLLRAEAMRGQGSTMIVALKEIERRVQTGQLTAADLMTLIDDALRRQADLSGAWKPAWGDLVESVRGQGLLDAVRWETYLTQAAEHTVKLLLRPRIRVGDVFPYQLQHTGARCGTRMKHQLRVESPSPQIGSLPQHSTTVRRSFGTTLCVTSSGASTSTHQLTPQQWEMLEQTPGLLPVTLEVEFIIAQNYGGTVEARFKRTLKGQVEIVPATESTVSAVVDEKQRQAMEKAVKVIRAEEEQSGRLVVVVSLEKPPIGVAYEVFAQIGQQRQKIGGVSIKPGNQTQWHISQTLELGDADEIDIELVPSGQVAAGTVDVFKYWGEPMWFRDVPVKRLTSASQPGTP